MAGCAANLQTFKFPVPYEELLNKTLTIELISPKPYGNDRYGVSVMPLFSLSPSDELIIWLELEAVDKEACGDLQLFLSFLASAQRLTVTVQEAVKLQRLEPNQSTIICSKINCLDLEKAGVYVKASLVMDGKVLMKRKSKTQTANASSSFIWNEALSFCDIDSKTLSK